MNKAEEFKLIEDFIGEEVRAELATSEIPIDYSLYIGDLWPVLQKIRAEALDKPEKLAVGWFAIAIELYKLDIPAIYEAVIGFIEYYNSLNVAPTIEESN